MEMILTPDQSKRARDELKMDQATAARTVGINRPMLSFFESGKMIPTEKVLFSLRNLYESSGYEFADSEDAPDISELAIDQDPPQPMALSRQDTSKKNGFYPRDGFMVPHTVLEKAADELVGDLGEIMSEIRSILDQPVENGSIFGFSLDGDSQERHDRAMKLMALYVCLSQELRGTPLPVMSLPEDEAREAPENHAGYLARILAADLGFADANPEPSSEPVMA